MYTGRRILIVEDEPLIAMLIADWLVELGCELAGTVNAAPEDFGSLRQMPLDAALLDVNLRGGSSFGLADALMDGGVPIAFITGENSHSLPDRFKQTPVLSKPFDFGSIEHLLGQLFARADETSL